MLLGTISSTKMFLIRNELRQKQITLYCYHSFIVEIEIIVLSNKGVELLISVTNWKMRGRDRLGMDKRIW